MTLQERLFNIYVHGPGKTSKVIHRTTSFGKISLPYEEAWWQIVFNTQAFFFIKAFTLLVLCHLRLEEEPALRKTLHLAPELQWTGHHLLTPASTADQPLRMHNLSFWHSKAYKLFVLSRSDDICCKRGLIAFIRLFHCIVIRNKKHITLA